MPTPTPTPTPTQDQHPTPDDDDDDDDDQPKTTTRYAWDLDRDGFADIPSHPGRRFLHASVMEDMAKNPACRDTLEQELNRRTADVLDLKESASARTDSKRGADMW